MGHGKVFRPDKVMFSLSSPSLDLLVTDAKSPEPAEKDRGPVVDDDP